MRAPRRDGPDMALETREEAPRDATPPEPWPRPDPPGSRGIWGGPLPYGIAALLLLWMWQQGIASLAVQTISYREFKERLAAGTVAEVRVGPDEIEGKLVEKKKPSA